MYKNNLTTPWITHSLNSYTVLAILDISNFKKKKTSSTLYCLHLYITHFNVWCPIVALCKPTICMSYNSGIFNLTSSFMYCNTRTNIGIIRNCHAALFVNLLKSFGIYFIAL